MKFKLDENFSPTIQAVFHQRELDCHTVREKHLAGADDTTILKAAVAEGRILVHSLRSVVAGACQRLLGSVPHQHLSPIR